MLNDAHIKAPYTLGVTLLRVAVLTSQVHYVPNNYRDFIASLVQHKGAAQVSLVIQLNNWNLPLFFKSAAIAMVAPNIGAQLLKNGLQSNAGKLELLCRQYDIAFTATESINTAAFRQTLIDHKIDLLINARTRAIFGKKLLATPRLGCLNVHHGLLPLQRGTFCDFHALRRGENPGFSIHVMTEKLDDGAILAQKSLPYQPNYLDYVYSSSAVEGETLGRLLQEIAASDKIPAAMMPNTGEAIYYKTPTWTQLLFLKRNGVKI